MLADAAAPPSLLHPSLAEIYRIRIESLSAALGRADTREEAAEVVRSLVSAIELTPESGGLAIRLRGYLAAMLSVAANSKNAGQPLRAAGVSIAHLAQSSLVAGACNQRYLRLHSCVVKQCELVRNVDRLT